MNDLSTDTTAFPTTWRWLDDVAVMDLPDPRFIVNGVIQDAGIGVLYSPPGVGKTTLLASLEVAVATGHRWMGRAVLDAGRCTHVGAEDPSGFKVRLRAAKLAAGLRLDVPIGVFTFPEAIDICDAAQVDRFCRFLDVQPSGGQPLKLVVFDTYAASTPGANENSAEDTTTAMVNAIKIRDRFGATVVLAHHTNAGGTRERGHSAMRGAADFMLSLTQADDLIHLECSKLRNGAMFDRIALRMTAAPDDLPGMVIRLASDVADDTGRLSPNQRKALEALRDSFRITGATRTEWLNACAGIPPASLYRAADQLVEKGYVRIVDGRYRPTEKGVAA